MAVLQEVFFSNVGSWGSKLGWGSKSSGWWGVWVLVRRLGSSWVSYLQGSMRLPGPGAENEPTVSCILVGRMLGRICGSLDTLAL